MEISNAKKNDILNKPAKTDKVKRKNRLRSTALIHLQSFVIFLAILLTIFSVWEGLVRAQVVSPLFPSPLLVFQKGAELISDPFYYVGINDMGIGWQLWASIKRVFTGFFLAVLIAVPLGFFAGMSPVLSKAIDPFIQVLKPVSPLAWLPIGLSMLQDSEGTAIFIIFISSIWPLLLNTIFAVRQIPTTYLHVAQIFEVNRWLLIRKILWPASLPHIVNGLRVSMGVAWLVIIAAEMLIGGKGIGYFIWNEWNNLDIANIMVAILLIGLVGITLDRLLAWVEKRVRYEE